MSHVMSMVSGPAVGQVVNPLEAYGDGRDDEHEIVLPRGTEFKVVSVDERQYYNKTLKYITVRPVGQFKAAFASIFTTLLKSRKSDRFIWSPGEIVVTKKVKTNE
ncbi:MAG: hypothetical protein KGL39_26715 [Patescibacteria group bacterium]|nr:hypothetical protein [Patescibacteria group bacterium]